MNSVGKPVGLQQMESNREPVNADYNWYTH